MSRLVWAASTSEGIAHAARPGQPRTLCGQRTVDPRWAWPELERCPACLVLEATPAVVLNRIDERLTSGGRR